MGKAETNLTNHMKADARALYGPDRLVIVKYHGNEYSQAGVSDLLGCLDGTFFACEVKAPESYGGDVNRALNEGPTVKQKSFLGKVLNANGYAWVAATRAQFLEGLAAIDQMNRERCAWCPTEQRSGDSWPCHIHPAYIPIPIYKV